VNVYRLFTRDWILLSLKKPNLAKPEAKFFTAKNAKSAKKNPKTFALFAFFAVKFLSFVGTCAHFMNKKMTG
jgi:hypothetical protein